MLELSVTNIIFTVINVLVLYFIFRKFLFGRVKKVLKERQEAIQKQIDDVSQAKTEADALKQKYENLQAAEEEEHRTVVDKAKMEASQEYGRIVDSAKEEAEKILTEARERADREIRDQKNAAKDSLTDMVVTAVEKISADHDSAGNDSNIYDLFVRNLNEQQAETAGKTAVPAAPADTDAKTGDKQ